MVHTLIKQITRVWVLILLVLFAWPTARAQQLGEMVLRGDELASLPNATANRPSQITLFHATAAQEQTVTRGPFVLSLAQRAAAAVKPQSPVIVISHGSGGGAIPWIDFARQLVQAGFVVAVPKHSGDNSEDQTDVGPASWRKRPLELSATLDALAAHPLWSGLLDVQRAGVFGMSAGGHTALVLAGGVWSELRYGEHCRKNLEQDFNTCVGLMMHLSGRPTDALKLAGANAVLAVRNTDPAPLSHADSRFKAAVASVPMAAPFAPETLAQPRIPLGFMRAELDTWLHPKFHSDAITAQCLPRKSCTMISDWRTGGHGSPLSPWPPELAKSISPLMVDPPGFDRAAAVPKAYADVVAFFLKHVRWPNLYSLPVSNSSLLQSVWYRLLLVLAVGLLFAGFMGLGRADGRWDAQVVYSVSSALLIWLGIEALRRAVGSGDNELMPLRWYTLLGVFACITLGWAFGTFIGDAYLGKSTWDLLHLRPALFAEFLLTAFIGTLGVLAWFGTKLRQVRMQAEVQASQRLAADAQLALMRSQLEPHMLFNTLANLRALIETDQTKALAMLDRMNAWLRSSLSASRMAEGEGRLGQEFARLEDYLALMAVRLGPRLRVKLDLPKDLAVARLPALLLQPSIENAVRHGLEPVPQGGELQVRASAHGDQLKIEVRDTGAGLLPSWREGLGLSHVRERLAALHGERAGMRLESQPEGGTVVTLWLPLELT